MKVNRKAYSIVVLSMISIAVLLFRCSTSDHKLTLINLRCEYLENPSGIDILKPRFSWNILSGERGVIQSAYRIIVSDNPGGLKDEAGNIWDSGKVPSDITVNVAYDGSPLKSGSTYYWSLCIWDGEGEQSSWSEPAFFHTGLFSENDWHAQWITAGDTLSDAPLLRKEFMVDKEVREAFVYVTGLGYYELYLNGKKVGDHVLDPGMSDFRRRVLYSTYDVTENLKRGKNVAGAFLGNGSYNLVKTENRYSWGNETSGIINPPVFIMQLEIIYSDGTLSRVITDGTWKSSQSPITFNNVFGGEDYDARLEKSGWSENDYDPSGWVSVKLTKSPGGMMRSQSIPPIRVTATLEPVAHTNPEKGIYLYDMGLNYAGWWRVNVEGEEGVKIRIRGAETLNDSLFPEPLKAGDRLSTKLRYHSNVWTDYTLKGKDRETYEPRFFYTGLRYLEITTDTPEKLKITHVEGRVAGTDLEMAGDFVTSDTLINRIHRANLRAQKSNTHGYPTDCPHREKGGYTGDGQIIAEASIHNFRMGAFYTKWLNDMLDAQEVNGRIPNTSPTNVGGMGGGIAWGSAYILIPWWMYQYYDDSEILGVHYKSMKQYMAYLQNLARTDANPGEPYIINDFMSYWYSLGEWCAPGQTDCPVHPMVNTCYYYMNSILMSKIASTLGQSGDANRYSALADTLRNEINHKFLNVNNFNYATDSTYQTYQLLALAGNIVPREFREQVFKVLTDDIEVTRKGHLNTGIIGTKYLWPVLAHSGRSGLAYSVIKKTSYPGYGYWIEKGSTTLLEQWDGKNSHNHQMFGSVDEYFYKYLAGIRSPEDSGTTRGYKHILIQPYVPEDLSYVNSYVITTAGMIASEWKQDEGKFVFKVTIPANTTATIKIPVFYLKNVSVSEGATKIWENNAFIKGTKGINGGSTEKDFLSFETGSGKYEFTISRTARK